MGFNLVATKSFLAQNLFYFISTSAANTVRVFRPGRFRQNAQSVWSHPLTDISTVWRLQVSHSAFLSAATAAASTILTILLFACNREGIPKISTLHLAWDNISGNKFSSFSYLFNLPVVLVYRIYGPLICFVHEVYRENASTDGIQRDKI
jgi:hypothetical protein